MQCEKCGKEHDGSYGSGRFCSKSCANSHRKNSANIERVKESIRISLDKHFERGTICSKCGKLFHARDFSRKLCFECLPKTIKRIRTNNGKVPKSILDVSSRTTSKILRRLKIPCTCCGFYVEGIVLDTHHIVMTSKGGSDDMSNITYICPNCHRIAHTDITKLTKPLISVEAYFKEHNIDWRSYYYGITSEMDEG